MDLIEIGGRVKARRKSLGLSQEKLSEMVFVTPHYIYEIERGSKSMSLETLMNISKALGISADYIIFGDSSHGRSDAINARISAVFKGCTDDEAALMLSVAESAKNAVRER